MPRTSFVKLKGSGATVRPIKTPISPSVRSFLAEDGPRFSIVFERQGLALLGPGVVKLDDDYRVNDSPKTMWLVANGQGYEAVRWR